MRRRDFIQAAGCFAAGFAERKPNIVFVLTETLGIGGLSCYGADNFKTPNIDRLARGGTRFTRAFATPLTGPSRALMMTGRYAFRPKPPVETMIPKILKTAGYVSAAVGKWGFPLGPVESGFDEYLKFNGSGVYWNKQANGKTYTVNGEVRSLRDKEYMPDVMHDFLIDFIGRHRAQPFYAYYAMSQMRAEIFPTPDSAPDSNDYYTDNIVYMDKLIGKLVGELDRLKLRENTLIVFVSDSGTASVYAGESTVGGRRLAGEKGSMLEGGALVPLIVNWPGKTPAGKISSDLIDASDFLPALIEVAGAKLPANTVIDGRSFAPQLYGKKGQPRDWIFVQLGAEWYVRETGWKLNQAGELFDMSHAPFEEPLAAGDTKNQVATAARRRLQGALDKLNPAAGILDEEDGTARRVNRDRHTRKKKKDR